MYSSGRKLLIFVIISIILLSLLGYAWKQRTAVAYISAPLVNLTTPFAYGANKVGLQIKTGFKIIDEAFLRYHEIEKLKQQIIEDKVDQSNYKELVAQNIRLRQMLQFKTTHPEYQMIAGQIIMRNFGSGSYTFMIDAGENEGVRTLMPVVAPGGVVGFISDVYTHSARVQTLLDPRTSIGVIVQRPESRLASIVRGVNNNGSHLSLVDLPKDGDVLAGDTLVTSGYGGIYPKGILVGHVDKIEGNGEGFVNNATVNPSVNFYNLEEVFVITQSYVPTPVWTKGDIKLIPPTKRDQVEGVKGAVNNEKP